MVMQCRGDDCPRDYLYIVECERCSDLFAEPRIFNGPCVSCMDMTVDFLETGIRPFDLHRLKPVASVHYHDYPSLAPVKAKYIAEYRKLLGRPARREEEQRSPYRQFIMPRQF